MSKYLHKILRQAVDTCLPALRFNDIESFQRAFHPEAKLFFVQKEGAIG
jgi:hypothetical protein